MNKLAHIFFLVGSTLAAAQFTPDAWPSWEHPVGAPKDVRQQQVYSAIVERACLVWPGYGDLPTNSAPVLYINERSNCVAFKAWVSAYCSNFVDTSEADERNYSVWFSDPSHTGFPMWTKDALLADVGAPSNFFDFTPWQKLSGYGASNANADTAEGYSVLDYGWRYATQLFARLVWTRVYAEQAIVKRVLQSDALDSDAVCLNPPNSIEASAARVYAQAVPDSVVSTQFFDGPVFNMNVQSEQNLNLAAGAMEEDATWAGTYVANNEMARFYLGVYAPTCAVALAPWLQVYVKTNLAAAGTHCGSNVVTILNGLESQEDFCGFNLRGSFSAYQGGGTNIFTLVQSGTDGGHGGGVYTVNEASPITLAGEDQPLQALFSTVARARFLDVPCDDSAQELITSYLFETAPDGCGATVHAPECLSEVNSARSWELSHTVRLGIEPAILLQWDVNEDECLIYR